MHTGMPLRVFVDTHDRGSQMLTKTFCWGSLGSLPGDTRVAVRLSSRISRHFRSDMEIGGPGAQGNLVTWVLDWDPQINFCSVTSPLLFCSSLNYKPFHQAWMDDHWMCVVFFPPLFPFISIWGTMRCSCPPACCEMWQRGPFSEKLAAISAIMLIFTCVPCRTEFSLCTETSPGNCCKTKTHQSTKALNERLNCR